MSLRDHIAIAIRNELVDLRGVFSQVPYIRVYQTSGRHSVPRIREMTVEGPIGQCAVCQEDFQIGELFVPLPCNDIHPHKFHKECIMPWLRSNNTCPTCRGTIS